MLHAPKRARTRSSGNAAPCACSIVDSPHPYIGGWRFEVSAIDIPYNNYPFALIAGITPNISPEVATGGPYSGEVGAPITLNANESFDPDGNIVLFEWDLDNDGIYDISSESSILEYTWGEEYNGLIVLRVTDNEGETSNATTTVAIGSAGIIIEVEIDIKPGSFPNSINLGSDGKVPVAIISKSDFDATQVNPISVTLAGASVKLKGKGTPMASFEDINNDNLMDVIVHVDTSTLQLSSSDIEAILEGETYDGKRFRGKDSVRIVK